MAARVLAPIAAEARSPLPPMATPEEDEIGKAFADWSVTDPALLTKLMQMCRTYNKTADTLAIKWEMLCMNGKIPTKTMTIDTLSELEARLATDSKAAGNPKTATLQSSKARPMSTFNKDTAHLLHAGVLGASTPQRGARPGAPISPLLSSSPSTGAFASRQDSGKVVHTVNPLLGPAAGMPQLQVEAQSVPDNTHFMWERMDDRARLLDEGVEALEQELMQEPGLPPLRSITTCGMEVTVAGRVCGEVDGRLNAKSVFIEGSRGRSNGFRVRLDLSQCAEYALFPGQLARRTRHTGLARVPVRQAGALTAGRATCGGGGGGDGDRRRRRCACAVRVCPTRGALHHYAAQIGACGINSSGHTFLARRILTSPRPPAPRPAAAPLAEPFNVMSAAGPFCCTDDLNYAPLVALLKEAKVRRAALLVLHGPFVDENHPTAGSEELAVPFEELFEQHVLERLQAFVEEQLEAGGAVTQVVLLPSVRDVHHSPVFPQPKFGSALRKAVRPHLRLLPNPACFTAGGYSFAASSLDTMMLLTQQELSKTPPQQPGQPRPERLSRLASHIVRQRQFLPLFPASADASVAVDVTHNLQAGTIGVRPHVLFVPSDLGPFAKPADGGVLAVNSGRAARGSGGGTFAFLALHPPFAPEPKEEPETGEVAAEGAAAPMEVEEEAAPPDAAPADAAPANAAPDAAPAESTLAASSAEAAAQPAPEPMEGVTDAAAPAAVTGDAAAAGASVAIKQESGGSAEAKPPSDADDEASLAAAAEAARAAREAAVEEAAKAHDVLPRTFVEIVRI